MTVHTARRAKVGFFLLLALSAAPSAALAQQEFVVAGDKIINSMARGEFVRISERLTVSQLKRRFGLYQVRSTAGEDCQICAVVARGNFSFEIHYDEDGIVVTQIFCRDPACVDSLGNKIQGSLRRAVGNEARCDAGDETTCASFSLTGLSYIVQTDEKCQLEVSENSKATRIPACAKIGGFQIMKP